MSSDALALEISASAKSAESQPSKPQIFTFLLESKKQNNAADICRGGWNLGDLKRLFD